VCVCSCLSFILPFQVTLTVMSPSPHQYVPEESHPVSITSPPDHRMIAMSVMDQELAEQMQEQEQEQEEVRQREEKVG
jgi:hypothetical protein